MILRTVGVKNNIEKTENYKQEFSFETLVSYLNHRMPDFDVHEKTFPSLILHRVSELEDEKGKVSFENYKEFEEIFNYVYYLTSNVLNQDEIFWGLGFPIPDKAFYGQDTFFNLLDSRIELLDEKLNTPFYRDFDFSNKVLYLLVLQRLYNLPVLNFKQLYEKIENEVSRYYQLKIDFTFLDVKPINALPELDLTCLHEREIKSFEDIAPLLASINLESFIFSGFTILKFLDKTTETVNDKIFNLISKLPSTDVINDISSFNRDVFWGELKNIVHTITNSNQVNSSFFPLLELNGFPVLTSDLAKDSIFFGDLIKRERDHCHSNIFSYLKQPFTITYGIADTLDSSDLMLIEHFKTLGLKSYICFPLKYKDNLVGFLELYTYSEPLDRGQLLNVASFLSALTNLASDLVATFKNSMDKIILDKYTSLQEAVQWRFNQVAANYLSEVSLSNSQGELEKIKFEKVYPVYGAVDVRNSTQLRNMAYKKDSYQRIGLLQLLVDQLESNNLNAEELKFIQRFNTVKNWLDNGKIDYYLLDILSFFQEDVTLFLDNLKNTDHIIQKVKTQYLDENSGRFGVKDGACEQFELTLAKLNKIINQELQVFNSDVQLQFPSYFEKFRTDGIEYDLYVGQSITPTKLFTDSILRSIRKKQIKSMISIAKNTYQIIDELPVTLVTTQLVFIHPNPIDVSFRQDERRFDVEGGYNIRYEVIKKRIDKALIKGSNERLVQPNKIAIVYSSNRVESEIRTILEELIDENFIASDIESLVLDELQGIDELRAFRVNVLLD